MSSYSEQLAAWTLDLSYDDIPSDVLETTKYRVLDVIGLAVAGLGTQFGDSVRRAAQAMGGSGPARVLGSGERLAAPTAAFANGALSQAMEYDDTHNESIVHISGPSVAAALALADEIAISGPELLAGIVVGNEISCRAGSIAPGSFHKRGFHPTGLFAVFGTAYLAGRLLGLERGQMSSAAGIAGSFSSGILESWVDGTQSKYLHPGWAANGGITAAQLARAGATGPAAVFEGRFGMIASHLQDPDVPRDFGRLTRDLGTTWESRGASFKPWPAAHVIHPYIDALLRVREAHGIDPAAVREIVVPVAEYILPIVCEPVDEKRRPRSAPHGRVSMQYTLAEALHHGSLGKNAYAQASLQDPAILALADKVTVQADPDFPGPTRFKGAVTVVMDDGTSYVEVEEHNRGSPENPMTSEELLAKFHDNTSEVLPSDQRDRLIEAVLALDRSASAAHVVDLAVRA